MSIADELTLLANTKENLRLSLGLSKDVPFSQYASHIPYYAKAGTVFDFTNNQYSRGQLPVDLSDISEFIRLSSATKWQDGRLVEVVSNIPRISGDGLLIEPQRTNSFSDAVITTKGVEFGVIPATLEVGEGNVVPAVRFPHGKEAYSYVKMSNPNPCVISAYVKNSDNSKPEFTSPAGSARNDFTFVLAGKPVGGRYAVSRHGDVYRVSCIYVNPEEASGNTGIVKYSGNSAKDLTATYRQVEDGDTLTSLIISSGSPATRSPDILNIPLLPTQTITGDWDEGVTYTVADGIATFSGHGYIRNITVETL